jgi:hypothetical protein
VLNRSIIQGCESIEKEAINAARVIWKGLREKLQMS